MSCKHMDLTASVNVTYMEDTGRFQADISIECSACKEPFRFLGLRAGLSFERPMVSPDELELRAPIEPQGEPRLQSKAVFEMPRKGYDA